MKPSTSDTAGGWRRHRTTLEERQRWIAAWERSQQTQAQFAASHGLSVATLRNWVRQRASDGSGEPARPKFIEVDLGRLVGPQASPGPVAWEFEIRTPGGWVVAVACGTPVERLQAVLEALRC